MGFVRLAVFGLIGLTAIYFLISIYSRSVRREKLENRWDADHPDGADDAARDAYIEQGMKEYESGFRKKLILLVYVIPIILITVAFFITNSN